MKIAHRLIPYYDEKGYDALLVEKIGDGYLLGIFDAMGNVEAFERILELVKS